VLWSLKSALTCSDVVALLAEQSSDDPKLKGSIPATVSIGQKCKNNIMANIDSTVGRTRV
jgi:hypothetical protein